MLYKKLPVETQNIIARHYGNTQDSSVFESILEKHKQDFVDIRYFIEHKGWTKMNMKK